MSDRHVAPYGSWKSPITSELIVSDVIRFEAIAIDGDDIYWIEMRPTEKGRYVLVRRTADDRLEDLTSVPFNVRTRVHEYGGGAFAVNHGNVYFSNFDDQRLYHLSSANESVPITRHNSRTRTAYQRLRVNRRSVVGGLYSVPAYCTCEHRRNWFYYL